MKNISVLSLILSALTKVSRQLDVSMGNMMGLVNGFAVAIFLVLIYLLSKIIIEKNAQSISMAKILGYTDGEIGRLYILSTSIVVILCLLFSFPIEETFMKIIFREMMLASISGWITLWIDPKIYVEMFVIGAVTYAVVAALEYRKIQKVPMDEALKNVE
ncbi:MAG: FtsX-like permease family protein [Lachnospiraceae bacterium]